MRRFRFKKNAGAFLSSAWLLAFLLLFPVPIHADPDFWISKAEEQFQKGDKKGALESFQRASWERPQDPILHYNMGVIAESLGRLQEAVDHYLSYLRWDPLSPDSETVKRRVFLLCGKLGSRAYQKQMFDPALDWFKKAKKLYPKSKAVYFNLGRVYETKGDLKQAEVSFKTYWDLCNNKEKKAAAKWIAVLLQRRAEIYSQKRQYKDALFAYQEAAKWEPDNPHLVLGQAQCEERLNLLEKSRGHYLDYLKTRTTGQETQGIVQKLDRIHLILADQYLRKGDSDKAEDILLKGLEVNPDNGNLHYFLARTYRNKNQLAKALRQLEEVIRLTPDEEDARYTNEMVDLCTVLADKAFQDKDYRDARNFLKKAQAKDPQNPFVAYNLAKIYDREQEWNLALQEYRKYISLAPNAQDRNEIKERVAYIHYVLGADLYQKGNYAKAQESFEKALLIRPHDPALLYNTALVLQKRGKTEAAVHFFERYMQYEKNPEEIRRVQEQVARLLRKTKEGERYAQKENKPLPVMGTVPLPEDPLRGDLGFRKRAYLFLKSGRWEEAISLYEQHIRQFPADRKEESLQEEISLAYRELSRSALLKGRYSRAIASLQKAKQWSPSESSSYLWEGSVYESLRRSDDALQIYQESLRVVSDPEDRKALFNKISGILTYQMQTALRQKDYSRALQILSYLEPYLRDDQKKDIHYQRARIKQAMGNHEEALVHYGFHLNQAPRALENPRLLEEITRQVGGDADIKAVLEDVNQAYEMGKLAAEKGDHHKALFCLLVARGQGNAQEDVEKGILESVRSLHLDLDPMEVLSPEPSDVPGFLSQEQKALFVEMSKSRLEAFYENGLYEEGLDLLRKMRALEPSGELAVMQGVFEEMLGKNDEAIEQYEIALLGRESIPQGLSQSAKTNLSNLLIRKAIHKYEQNQFRESLTLLKQAEKITPYRRDIAFNLGCIFLRQREPYKALDAFTRYIALTPEDSPRKKLTSKAVSILKKQIARSPAVRYDNWGVKVDLVFEKPYSLGQLLSSNPADEAKAREKELLDGVFLAPYLERPLKQGIPQSLPLTARGR